MYAQIRYRAGQKRHLFKLRYQGAGLASGENVEIVGLQKLQIQSASRVAIGANLFDFFIAASPSSHHPHRPLGAGQFIAERISFYQ